MLSKLREPINGLTHLGGAIAASIGLYFLLGSAAGGTLKLVSALIYGVSLILLFSASAAYHSIPGTPPTVELLRKLDHAAIYLLIAGTYTPICLNAFSGFFRWGLLGIIWGIAVTGILFKLFYVEEPRWLGALIYVLMGWLCISAAGQMLTALSPVALTWLIVGGVIYTFGALIYATKIFDVAPQTFGYHGFWHICVLLGAAAHFLAVLGVLTS